jgi:hypothetical protein
MSALIDEANATRAKDDDIEDADSE